VAWRRRDLEPARVEPPLWYRVYDPAAWDEPDAQERAMIDGCRSLMPWPDDLHQAHSERRWHEAKHRYRQAHPDLAEQEFTDLIEGYRHRRENGTPPA
jgi:hypothetical protein